MKRLTRLCWIVLSLGSSPLFASGLKSDETIIYFPTDAAWQEQSQQWQVTLHGWIFEVEEDSLWRRGALSLLEQQLELPPHSDGAAHLKARGWPFLVDNERGKNLHVDIAGSHTRLSPSAPNGHFFGETMISAPQAQGAMPVRWLPFDTLMPKGDERHFSGAVQLIPPSGLSVISDIDDTIKLSNVLNKDELLANTFLRDFQAIPGMAERYREWAAQGAAFHYVTGSPWQLYPALSAFLDQEAFPPGSFAMRPFRLKDGSLIDFLSSSEPYKVATIDALFKRYPGRQFILVGDSGEKDPEVYGEIARRYPAQVSAIYIRNVTKEERDSPRLLAAFVQVEPSHWQLFGSGDEIAPLAVGQHAP